jgi:hypothetical protein
LPERIGLQELVKNNLRKKIGREQPVANNLAEAISMKKLT